MVELFKFQETVIRTEIVNGEVWFSGQDIFSVLGLTWKGASELINKRGIDTKRIVKRGTITSGGKQEMVFIDEIALYKITLRANKSEVADKFTDWVAELLVKIRKSIEAGNDNDLRKHLNISTQKDYSKKINGVNFNDGGLTKTIDYNVKNCEYHTDLKPYQVIKMGKDAGLKSKQVTSAKEVIRNLKPEIACSMSLTDKLVSENGIEHKIAAEICKTKATQLFEAFLNIGFNPNELMQ